MKRFTLLSMSEDQSTLKAYKLKDWKILSVRRATQYSIAMFALCKGLLMTDFDILSFFISSRNFSNDCNWEWISSTKLMSNFIPSSLFSEDVKDSIGNSNLKRHQQGKLLLFINSTEWMAEKIGRKPSKVKREMKASGGKINRPTKLSTLFCVPHSSLSSTAPSASLKKIFSAQKGKKNWYKKSRKEKGNKKEAGKVENFEASINQSMDENKQEFEDEMWAGTQVKRGSK